jgi:CO dehydrogenase/acetyl-CoA synthase alpha subunit
MANAILQASTNKFLSYTKLLTMELQELRDRLTVYILEAEEKKIQALYTLLENEIEGEYKWHEDEAFLKELDEDYRKYESGEEPGCPAEEVYAAIHEKLEKRKLANV